MLGGNLVDFATFAPTLRSLRLKASPQSPLRIREERMVSRVFCDPPQVYCFKTAGLQASRFVSSFLRAALH
jgi:hypothetical protein